MRILKRLRNIVRYGFGDDARERKRADKRGAKRERFESARWEREGDLARRRYASYDEYVAHQSSKLDGIVDRLRENQDAELEEFVARFQACPALAGARTVLCLGARLGTEVRALHRLGHFAVGIDLNPGPDNAWVLPGDFHHLVFPDGSVDAIYTNAMDHVFDLERMIGEVVRVLAPGGVFLAEIETGFDEGHVPGDFEAIHWRDSDALVARVAEAGKLLVGEIHELGATRRGERRLASFRKPG